jgi:hypothetical protein
MKRYCFDGTLETRRCARHGIAAVLLLCATSAHAARTMPEEFRTADAGDARVLSPAEVEDGLRVRMFDLKNRNQSRGARRALEAPRDYSVDEPPPDADVPLPADAVGGDVFEERLEVMP